MILSKYINLFNEVFGLTFEQIKDPKGPCVRTMQLLFREKLREANVSEKGIISLLGDRVMPRGYNNFLGLYRLKRKKRAAIKEGNKKIKEV